MQGFYALVFCIAWFFGVAELSLISNSDALNMHDSCSQYLASKHTGFHCVSTDVRLTGAGIVLFALITLLLSVKSKAKTIFIIAAFVSFTVLSASIIRIFYFIQNHTTINYFFWSLLMLSLGFFILYLLRKIPLNDSANSSRLHSNAQEMHRLELEIKERRKEKDDRKT